MARGAVAGQLPGMAANPYPRPKEQISMVTICELCDRSIRTLDWSAHKNSKKHREAEAKERGEIAPTSGFGGDAAGFEADTNGSNDFNSDNTWGTAGASSITDTWGSGGNSNQFSGGGNTGGGGGDRNCFSCGLPGHTKRDCPSGGSGGGGQACYGCGDIGHQKRDCPKSSGGQACYNCGENG